MLMQQILNGVVVGSVYGLFALGFTLIFGVNHIMNLAHGSVFMLGAFAGLYSVIVFDAPFPVVLLIGGMAGGFVSVVLDLVAFRPLRRHGSLEFSSMISSIGANLVLLSLAQQLTATRVMRFPFDTFPIIVFNFQHEGNIERVILGERIGTRVVPAAQIKASTKDEQHGPG